MEPLPALGKSVWFERGARPPNGGCPDVAACRVSQGRRSVTGAEPTPARGRGTALYDRPWSRQRLGLDRTSQTLWFDAIDRPCVKTHTSAECRKHNSPVRHRTSRVQYDLTLRDTISRRYFYVRRDRWSFRTGKTLSRHRPD